MNENRVRNEIVAQHDELRKLAREVEDLASRCAQNPEAGPDLGKQLHDSALGLYSKFSSHLDREQELLEPALRSGGAEGQRRASRLVREHDEQRELLDYLVGRLRQHPPTVLIARELQHFIEFLRGEMRGEEESLLTPDVLGHLED